MESKIMQGALAFATVLTLLSASAANAAWCGSTKRDNAIVECGYATVADCQQSVGKSGLCFVDPDVALKARASSAAKQLVQGKS
jgi:hypothetical protein